MTQHLNESTAASIQPQLFVFAQNLIFTDNEKKELILQEFDKNFETLLQSEWEKHWREQGEAIVLQHWHLKYSDYLEKSLEEQEAKETPKSGHEFTSTPICSYTGDDKANEKNSAASLEAQEYSESWQELWQQHVEEVYCEQYDLYTPIFNDFCLNFKRSLQIEEEQTEIEEQHHAEEAIAAELEQLQLLGLPTAFGARRQQNHKRHTIKQEAEEKDHSDDLFYSAEEDEEEEWFYMAEDKNEADEGAASFLHAIQQKAVTKPNKRKKVNRQLRNVPAFIREDKILLRYWSKRFSLFSRFDEGIRLDRESWFSVTPERVAAHLAQRLPCDVLIDGFCGSGGNAIQFAKTCGRVIAIDIDPLKVEMAKHNARIYGVSERIDFIVGDFLQMCEGGQLRGDVVFLSPPWGGPSYKRCKQYDIEQHLLPVGAPQLMKCARKICDNVALFLPRNSSIEQVIKLAGAGNRCELEHNYLDDRLVAITALYGEDILPKK